MFCSSCSINGDGAAEPVPDNLDEGEEERGAEEFCSSWPTTFTSTPSDTEESAASKQVAGLLLTDHSNFEFFALLGFNIVSHIYCINWNVLKES